MITAVVGAVVFLVTSSGSIPCGHDKVRRECSACGVENPEVQRQIDRLQASGWIGRKKAARALRKYDWKSHPEAADALAAAVLHDDCLLVRKEAAESLAKMKPCLPSVHEAVDRAAKCDKSMLTRHWAKKALKTLGKTCVETCSVCGEGSMAPPGITGEIIVPDGPVMESGPPIESGVEALPPAIDEAPAAGSSSVPPLPSPFRRESGRPVYPAPAPMLEGPVLEGPGTMLLPGPRPAPVGRLASPDAYAPGRPSRPYPTPMLMGRPNLAGTLLGLDVSGGE
ncbi:HEAT repeat domain-containing protein [Aquisphaera insulae]|uniref:HEAT repeat domain-containing protein n=1 Tax=Aquisphaera insulae TaxID=2712864 RepID=UPI0013EA8938|nr:HEAT repeat domain-containing protein [Aquisphaera insulae]